MTIPVRYIDEDLVVVSKPGALLTHRTALARDREVLLTRVRDQLDQHLYPVHRLDRATSGLVCFAFRSEVARDLQEVWGTDQVEKHYRCLVRGTPPDTFSSERPLTNRDNGIVQEAHTEFRTLARDREFAWVGAQLFTGRRHQIRRHLAHLGHQVAGDTSYGKGGINRWLREEFGLPRLVLHAVKLRLPHPPDSAQPLVITEPPATDLLEFLEKFSPTITAVAREEFAREAE